MAAGATGWRWRPICGLASASCAAAPEPPLVGDPETVAERLKEYMAVGVDTFVLSGYPHLEEAYRFGESVLPLLPRASRNRRAPGVVTNHRGPVRGDHRQCHRSRGAPRLRLLTGSPREEQRHAECLGNAGRGTAAGCAHPPWWSSAAASAGPCSHWRPRPRTARRGADGAGREGRSRPSPMAPAIRATCSTCRWRAMEVGPQAELRPVAEGEWHRPFPPPSRRRAAISPARSCRARLVRRLPRGAA